MDFKAMGADLGLDEDEFRELIDLFMETGQSDFDNLQTALAGGDSKAAGQYAHTISGASGNLGLMDLHATAKHVEAAAMDGDIEEASAQAAGMEEMFAAIATFVAG